MSDELRERLIEAASWAETPKHGRLGYAVAEAVTDAVLPIVAAEVDKARREALTEAADAITSVDWHEPVGHVRKWLLDRGRNR